MKYYFLTICLLLSCSISLAQYKMIIKKTDGTSIEIPTKEIKRVEFGQQEKEDPDIIYLENIITDITLYPVLFPATEILGVNYGIYQVCGENIKGTHDFYGLNLQESSFLSNPTKVFFLINPSNTDYSGLTLKFIGSRGESPLKMSPLVISDSDYLPSIGISRSDLRVYEAYASFENIDDAKKEQITYNVSSNQEIINSIIENGLKTTINTLIRHNSYSIAYAISSPNGKFVGPAQFINGSILPLSFHALGQISTNNFENIAYKNSDLTLQPTNVNSDYSSDKIISLIQNTIRNEKENISCLAPVMFAGNKDNDYHHISTDQSNPSYLRGNKITLVPTSYNFELISPSFKKAIIIKNLTTGTSITKDVNNQIINKAFDGSINVVDVEFPSSGLYEITYAALDYYGNVVEIPYYINVEI